MARHCTFFQCELPTTQPALLHRVRGIKYSSGPVKWIRIYCDKFYVLNSNNCVQIDLFIQMLAVYFPPSGAQFHPYSLIAETHPQLKRLPRVEQGENVANISYTLSDINIM